MEQETQPQPKYRCAQCGMAVIILGENVIHGCVHTDAAVLADMSADTFGIGSLMREEE